MLEGVCQFCSRESLLIGTLDEPRSARLDLLVLQSESISQKNNTRGEIRDARTDIRRGGRQLNSGAPR